MNSLPPEIAEVKRLLTELSAIPMPDELEERAFEGIYLENVESNVIGCASRFVRNKGELDAGRVEALQMAASDLDTAAPHVPPETAEYVERLRTLARQVLGLLGK